MDDSFIYIQRLVRDDCSIFYGDFFRIGQIFSFKIGLGVVLETFLVFREKALFSQGYLDRKGLTTV